MNGRFGLALVAVWVLCAPPVFAAEGRTRQPPLVIGAELACPPYSFLGENGKPTGYNVELTKVTPQVTGSDIKVRISVLAKRGRQRCLNKWGPTADYLGNRIPGYSFEIVPLDFVDIYPTAERKDVEFILANPSFYLGLEKLYGANRIATLENRRAGGVYTVYGGVIFRRADRDDIQNLDDLEGKTFMATKETSFGGWQAVWRKLKEHGIDPHRDFRDLSFGGSQDAVVHAVRDGKVDAGAVRTDTLERMANEGNIRKGDFHVLKHDHVGEDVCEFPFPHSTDIYPEWPIAKLKHTSDKLAEKVAVALVGMPADCPAAKAAMCAGWTVPLNYQPVHECLKELRVGPYKDFGKVRLSAVFRQYWPLPLTIFTVLITISLSAIRVAKLNRRLVRTVSTEETHAYQQTQVAEFGQLALSGVELDELFDRAVVLVSQTLDVKYANILEHIPEKHILFPRAGVGWKAGGVGHKSVPDEANSQGGYTLLQDESVIVEDIESETRFSPPALLTEHDVVGGMAVAIPGRQRPFGVLGVHTDHLRHFSDNDCHFLEAVANVLAGAIERHRTENQLRESEAQFRDAALSTSDWIWETNAEGRYTYCSEKVVDILGYTAEELLDTTPFDMMSVEEAARVKKIFSKIAADKEPIRDLENRHIAKDGREVVLLTNGVPRMDKAGNLLGYRGVDKDITERKRADEAVRDYTIALESATRISDEFRDAADAANRSKSEFLANMSHEIRTPMTAILGFSNVLLENMKDKENLSAAATIKRNGEYLLELINDILDLSKIEAGKLEIERIACSPSNVVGDVASLMRVRAEAKGLPLEVEYVGGIPENIVCDPTRLRQVLINLVGNAIKFTETGSVRLQTRLVQNIAKPPCLQFNIIDTGVGMTPEQALRLFQPFTQADASTTRKFGGTGLGLTISKRLAEMLGGDITVSSNPGRGSTFSVTVEAGPLDNATILENVTETVAEGKQKAKLAAAVKLDCRILLAEDGPDNQRLISFVLKKVGADVTLAENGLIAHDKALAAQEAGEPFDVILMDMQMPIMDGYTATKKLREADYAGPIIALTANAMAGDDEKCLQAGCDVYATKPIDRATLFGTIAQFLGQDASATEALAGSNG